MSIKALVEPIEQHDKRHWATLMDNNRATSPKTPRERPGQEMTGPTLSPT